MGSTWSNVPGPWVAEIFKLDQKRLSNVNGLWRGMVGYGCLCMVSGDAMPVVEDDYTFLTGEKEYPIVTMTVVSGELEVGAYLKSRLPNRGEVLLFVTSISRTEERLVFRVKVTATYSTISADAFARSRLSMVDVSTPCV